MVTMGGFEVQKCRWHEGGKYLCLFAGRRKSRVYPQSDLVTHGGTVDIWHAYGGHNCTLPAARLSLEYLYQPLCELLDHYKRYYLLQ